MTHVHIGLLNREQLDAAIEELDYLQPIENENRSE